VFSAFYLKKAFFLPRMVTKRVLAIWHRTSGSRRYSPEKTKTPRSEGLFPQKIAGAGLEPATSGL